MANKLTMLPPTLGTETILLVEDEDGVRTIVRQSLQRHGYTVLEASNGQAALAVAENHTGVIQLILTDMNLPIMSGRQLSKLLIERFPGIKVIYMTGYIDDDIPTRDFNQESHIMLQKPFSMPELIQKVQKVLSNKPADTSH